MASNNNSDSIGLAVYTSARNSSLQSDDSTVTPTPFQLLQTAAGTNNFLLNEASYLRKDFTYSDSTPITGSTTPLTLSDGDSVWLQLDTTGSSGGFDEASIVSGQTAPYETNGGNLMSCSGSGTVDDPFVWDESYTPLAQVFAADDSGKPTRGGIVYTVSTGDSPTQIEIVQLTCTHLAMRYIVRGGQVGQMALPDSGPLIS